MDNNGKPRRGDRELEEKIADWRRRQGSTEVSGETESGTEEEDKHHGRPALVYSYDDRGLAGDVKTLGAVEVISINHYVML